MIGMRVKIVDTTRTVEKAAEKAAFRNFRHAAASIRKTARASITRPPKAVATVATNKKAKGRGNRKKKRRVQVASPPGHPPYTKRGQLSRAIVFSAHKEGAVIGPRKSIVGTSASAHEFGGRYKGATYPERPFMGPALEKELTRIGPQWKASIGSG